MKTSSYNSVPVIASIIGSKSRRSMYLANITSLDGKRQYKDKWIPTSWNVTTKTEWRYTNKQRNINNQLIEPGKYYYFDFNESVLMTDQGAVNAYGSNLEVEGLTKVKMSAHRQSIEWKQDDSQSLYEFPMSRVSQAMHIEEYTGSISNIKSRLIDGVVKEYYQIVDKYIIFIPTWLIKNFDELYTVKTKQQKLFTNDDEFFGVAEQTAIDSYTAEKFDYMQRDTMHFEEIDSLTQWEQDNPEYATHS
jgi:hypothetical protein